MNSNSLRVDRRTLLGQAASVGVAVGASGALAGSNVMLLLPGGPDQRPLTDAFPQKGSMILQRIRPPLLETPFDVFDKGIFTPNDRFYVRWHWAVIPNQIDAASFRLRVHGSTERTLSLSLTDLLEFPRHEIVAVNQCSGNSRGFFQPRVPGGQWANGAMGNARWTGVSLKDVLDRAGVKGGAIQVRFKGLDEPVVPDGPHFLKSLDIDLARNGEVMIAYAMNGELLPLLNGYPLRLVVPGWYATYWVKMLSDIEVLSSADQNFWMKSAYTIPDTPFANMRPGQTGVKMIPINRMGPRSFITNLEQGSTVHAQVQTPVRGIAFGGDAGVAKLELSVDGGKTWRLARLDRDEGTYSFRRWETTVALPRGIRMLMVRCTNGKGEAQPATPNWNPSGFMRNVVETVTVTAV